MHSHPRLLLATASLCLLAFVCGGCGAGYMPRPSRRVSMVMQGGSFGYVRQGVFFRGGMFGGQLEGAVAGSEQAVQHARTYRRLTAAGFGMSMGGLAVVLIGEAIIVAALTSSPSSGGSSFVPLIAVGGVGLSLDIAGLFVTMAGAHHHYDAINVYNDEVEFGPPPGANGAPGGQVRIGPIVPTEPSRAPW